MISRLWRKGLIEYICAILIVMQCQSVFINTSRPVTATVSLFSFFSIIFLFFKSLKINNLNLYQDNERFYKFYLYGMILTFIYLVVQYLFIYKFKLNPVFPFWISIFLLTFYFYNEINNKDISKGLIYKITNVVFFLSLGSLFFYILNFFGMPTNVSIMNRWSSWPQSFNGYFYIDFISQPLQIGSKLFIKNSGIFAEPSIYGFVLVAALVLQVFVLYIKNKFDLLKLIIFVLTILTTVSSTAISLTIIILLISTAVMFSDLIKNYHSKKNKIVFFSILILGSFVIMYLFNAKKSDSLNIYSSYAIRMNDIHACILSWINSPIYGHGLGNDSYIAKYAFAYRLHSFGLSTGYFSILAYGGIILMAMYLLPNILIFFKNKRIFLVGIIINIYLIYAMVQETYLYAIFMSYMWATWLVNSKQGGKDFELFGSGIRSIWSDIRSRSIKKR